MFWSVSYGQSISNIVQKFTYTDLYELTRYSFRREQSGELVGLRRLRAFTMPDCHAFCKDMAQAVDEIKVRFDLSQSVLRELGIMNLIMIWQLDLLKIFTMKINLQLKN